MAGAFTFRLMVVNIKENGKKTSSTVGAQRNGLMVLSMKAFTLTVKSMAMEYIVGTTVPGIPGSGLKIRLKV